MSPSPVSSRGPGDHRARVRAQTELERPVVVEAGAGTGKTATLVARILAWSVGPGWEKAAVRLSGETREAPADGRVAAAALGGVLAITFTEAAAAEMAERVTSGLAELERGGRPVGLTALDAAALDAVALDAVALDAARQRVDADTVRRRAAALLGAAGHLQVRTLHAFCRRLLSDHPFEAGVHPHFTVDADAAVTREIVEEVVEAAVAAGYGDPGDDDYLMLAGRGHGPMELAAAVFDLASAGWTSAAFAGDPLAPERRRELLERLWQAANRMLTVLETRRVEATRARNAAAVAAGLGRLRRRLRRARAAGDLDLAELADWLDDALPENLTEHLRSWARGATSSQAEKERLASARGQLMPLAGELLRLRLHAGRLDPELLAASRRVLAPLLDRVHRAMRSRGVLGFADLLREAGDLARDRPSVLAQVRRRIDQLLVDEFQDTDPLQCELIRRLALEGPAGERPGLFAVGDPKQSIYGWRSADLAAYEDFVEAVLAAGGELLTLDENFRSTPAILDEVERVVAPVMRRRPGLQPEFRPLVAGALAPALSQGERDKRTAVEYWVSWVADSDDPGLPAEGKARETGELEARALAADLLELHASGTAWSDVGVLLRSLTDLEIYLAALREARVPFVVSRDRQYYRRREIIDAAALVRAVLAPEDRLATLTVLRSVVVGVPDAALLPLWSGGLPDLLADLSGPDAEALGAVRDLADRVARSLETGLGAGEVPGLDRVRGWEHNLVRMAVCLAELRSSFDRDPVDVFVDRLRRSTLFEACESARYLGVFRRANLERFFDELLADLADEENHRHRVLRRLRSRIAGGFEAEEARPPEAARDAVQVLTIHKAKGLEFRHVYLLQTHKEAGKLRAASLEIGDALGRPEYRIFGAATLGFDVLEARRDEVARAELVRTLYVAMTRASERLVVAGRRPLEGGGPPLERAATHMDLLLHRRGEAPSAGELVHGWQGGTPRLERGDVVWALPGAAAPAPEAPEEAAERGVSLPPAAEIRTYRDRLRDDRAAAARLMERPLRQVASKIGAERADEEPASVLVPPPEPPASEAERRAAMAAGSAIHRLLETFDLEAEPGEELARQRRTLSDLIGIYADEDVLPRALARAESVLDRLAGGRLLRRLAAVGAGVVAREMPVLLAPGPEDDAVGHLAGVVDLVYRDPETGELVVADFKTDRVASLEEAEAHARRYAEQGEVYVRALAEMLELEERPRFELWYLAADCLVGWRR